MTAIDITLDKWESLRDEFGFVEDENKIIYSITAHVSPKSILFEFRFIPINEYFSMDGFITITKEYTVHDS